jgi:hypothetical protein
MSLFRGRSTGFDVEAGDRLSVPPYVYASFMAPSQLQYPLGIGTPKQGDAIEKINGLRGEVCRTRCYLMSLSPAAVENRVAIHRSRDAGLLFQRLV